MSGPLRFRGRPRQASPEYMSDRGFGPRSFDRRCRKNAVSPMGGLAAGLTASHGP